MNEQVTISKKNLQGLGDEVEPSIQARLRLEEA
jgi:hypothetical protein